MTAADLALVASYVCPWGTILIAALALAWTTQRLSADGVFQGLFAVQALPPPRQPRLPTPLPSLRRHTPPPYVPAQVPIPQDDLGLDEPTGEFERREG